MQSCDKFHTWISSNYFDEETRRELEQIKDDIHEIEDRFYKDLEFGTGGLRGKIGAGTNRMNIYTVRRASQGLANYLLKTIAVENKKKVVIAFDSRHKSPEFALETAKVFAGNGIKAYLFDELKPTPELSFAVRHLNADAGIVITASHNPKEYNGYKVYGSDGGQLTLEASDAVQSEITGIEDITSVKVLDQEDAIREKLIVTIGQDIDDQYIARLKTLSLNSKLVREMSDEVKIVYTPLHGAGNKLVRRILGEIGFENVLIVEEQEVPDPDFSTVKTPNPEDKNSFALAIELAKRENADLIIGTDPDCDRVGLVVKKDDGEYGILTGNQTGCLLMNYILSQKKQRQELCENGFVVKTIVTTELARSIANGYNVELIEVLTGFKFIGEKIKELDEEGDKKFLFGFEESYGYLAGTHARDKDGVVVSMLAAEMAAFYKSKGLGLYQGLEDLFSEYGYVLEDLTSFTLEGKDGLDNIKDAMDNLRENVYSSFGSCRVKAVRDYLKGERHDFITGKDSILSLPSSNVLYYEMLDSSWFCIRPSGTEPKIKIYFGTMADNDTGARYKLENLKKNVLDIIKGLLFINE